MYQPDEADGHFNIEREISGYWQKKWFAKFIAWNGAREGCVNKKCSMGAYKANKSSGIPMPLDFWKRWGMNIAIPALETT